MNIKEISYELYKRNWVREHISQREELDSYINYAINHNTEGISFEECIEEYGYTNSMSYCCFEEFLDCEYRDSEYMKQIFGCYEESAISDVYGYKLLKLYMEDINIGFATVLQELNKKYKPARRHIISNDEKNLIRDILHIKDLSIDDLHNLRDFIVLSFDPDFGSDEDIISMRDSIDKLSAITYVIDLELLDRGEQIF